MEVESVLETPGTLPVEFEAVVRPRGLGPRPRQVRERKPRAEGAAQVPRARLAERGRAGQSQPLAPRPPWAGLMGDVCPESDRAGLRP